MESDGDETLTDLQPLIDQVQKTIPRSAASTGATATRAKRGVADKPVQKKRKAAGDDEVISVDHQDGEQGGAINEGAGAGPSNTAQGAGNTGEKGAGNTGEGTTKRGGRKKPLALSSEELASARIADLQLMTTGAQKSELALQWEEEQIQRVYAAAQLHNLEERNEVLRKQAKAMDKHNSTAVLEIRKLEAEAKLAESLTEKEALKHIGWADVKIKAIEARIVAKSKDDLAHQCRSTLRKLMLEQYIKDPTPQNFQALGMVYAAD
ncbi:hypothetical protein HD553DRAFT_325482 [Filobasidium floriforme]|uniref:uncharacterized protein n=1 Tax=Filobasidium floriforme TaxID=5210 RepID=UPI001E8E7480|nr:uncharacterized protein HD553DRAFT_325482 [Filobasidium floriforme]KAH8081459.1 hypothetical protein HD553DRAFT_325482 [Filobasidium floriforme]